MSLAGQEYVPKKCESKTRRFRHGSNKSRIRKAQKGRVQGEDLYYAYGRTDGGRYVFVVFIYKRTREALIISARDMDRKERKYYGKA
jgi:hypothetical protein